MTNKAAKTLEARETELRRQYARLSEPARALALVYGTACPNQLSYASLTEVCLNLDLPVFATCTAVSQRRDALKAAVVELLEAGIIFKPEKSQTARAHSHWSTFLTLEAHQQNYLMPMLQDFDLAFAHQGSGPQDSLAVFTRGFAVAEHHQGLQQLQEYHELPWHFLYQPGGQRVIERLSPQFLDQAIADAVATACARLVDCGSFLDLCENYADAGPTASASLAYAFALRGEYQRAEALFADLGTEFAVSATSTQALIASLQGRDQEAINLLGKTIEHARVGSRKRHIFPDLGSFHLALMSLVRSDTVKGQKYLDELLEAARKRKVRSSELSFVQNAISAQNNRSWGYLNFPSKAKGLDQLWDNLKLTWALLDHPQERTFWLEQYDSFISQMSQFAATAEASGWHWVARQAQAICDVLQHDESAQTPPPSGQGSADIVPLTHIQSQRPEWERAIEGLEELGVVYDRASYTGPDQPKKKPKRLAWIVGLDDWERVTVRPVEQNATKSGWSAGRNVSLKRLHTKTDEFTYLSPQDRTVAARIEDHYAPWSGRREFSIEGDAIAKLIGHPLVFDEQGNHVDVAEQAPEIYLQSIDADLIKATFHPFPQNISAYSFDFETPGKLFVTQFSDVHFQLAQLLGEDGMQLPKSAEARLLSALSAISSQVRVHGAGVDLAGDAQRIEADAEPWVQLVPLGSGLQITVQVQPIPDSGAFFNPGMGSTMLMHNLEDRVCQTQRDLQAEKLAAQKLLDTCTMLRDLGLGFDLGLGDWQSAVEDPQDCLELIDQLTQHQVRCLWPEGETFKIAARANSERMQLTVNSRQDWFEASGELAVDEQKVLSLAQLMQLMQVHPHSRFLPLDDNRYLAITTALRDQLDQLERVRRNRNTDQIELSAAAAIGLQNLFGACEVDADDAWQDLQDRLTNRQANDVALPSTLKAELRPYQQEGFAWLARLAHWQVGACLADDMGLGKTVQTLALLLHRAQDGPALVVAPTSVVTNWVREAQRFAPTLNVLHYHGATSERQGMLADCRTFSLVVTSYGVLVNDLEVLQEIHWSTLVIDEAQEIRNSKTHRARAVKQLNADFRLAATGTPIQNNLMDLQALFSFINPGLFGSEDEFRKRFALPIERYKDVQVQHQLRQAVTPFILRRSKSEVLQDLPSRTEIVLNVELSEQEATLYEALRINAVEKIAARVALGGRGNGQHHLELLAQLTRLRLACCHPRLVEHAGYKHSTKHQVFQETLTNLLANGHKVLVFSQFVKHLALIKEYLDQENIAYHYLDGQTPAPQRQKLIDAFQGGQGDVFLISLKAGGTGLNLTAADYVIHMDPWWNPAVEDQASDRAHRIGQTRPVTIYRLVTQGTIEEQIIELHHEKRDLAEQLLADSATAGRLDTDELLTLLQQPLTAT